MGSGGREAPKIKSGSRERGQEPLEKLEKFMFRVIGIIAVAILGLRVIGNIIQALGGGK